MGCARGAAAAAEQSPVGRRDIRAKRRDAEPFRTACRNARAKRRARAGRGVGARVAVPAVPRPAHEWRVCQRGHTGEAETAGEHSASACAGLPEQLGDDAEQPRSQREVTCIAAVVASNCAAASRGARCVRRARIVGVGVESPARGPRPSLRATGSSTDSGGGRARPAVPLYAADQCYG